MDLKPEILTHPNIPKPLHGLNPRAIKGQTWWDVTRQEVYKTTDYHCAACGVHKTQAKGNKKWLEAHEYYDIDYENGIAIVKDIVPLCNYCHKFIHSGFLYVEVQKGHMSKNEAITILERGFKILRENNLKAFYGTIDIADRLGANTTGIKSYTPTDSGVVWSDWRLMFDGKKHKPLFNNYEEWKYNYN